MNFEKYDDLKIRLSNLKSLSKDSHGDIVEYVTMLEKAAVNFDKVVKQYSADRNLKCIKSVDALMEIDDNNWVFIEFKNGVLDDKEKLGIKKKIYDSIFVLSDITSLKFSELRDMVEFVLVYNEEKNPESEDNDDSKGNEPPYSPSYDKFVGNMENLSNDEVIRFKLNYFKNYCFKDVHTYSKAKFESYLQKISQE